MKRKKPLEVTQAIYDIFVKDELDHFSIQDLKESYLKKINSTDLALATKVSFSNISILKKSGMLSKVESNDMQSPIYHKTTLFHELGLIGDGKEDYPVTRSNSKTSTKILLTERLTKRQNELIASIAEVEEYVGWYKSIPSIKHQIESNYLLSCERSYKLMGQVKAIKGIISSL